MKYKDYYQTLGVSRDAKPEEVKRAYRRLARKYHPDVSSEADAEARFKEIGEAYEVLKDEKKRAAYDNLGMNWRAGEDFTPPPGWEPGPGFGPGFSGAGFDFSDFFEALFGGGRGQRRRGGFEGFDPFSGHARAGPRAATRGRDENVRVRIPLADAFHGAERNLEIEESGGRRRRLKVKIPAGVTAGQRIRLSGQGAQGASGGRSGDMYLEVELESHPVYRVEGKDVHMDLPIAPWEAALGATVKVPTLGGNFDIKIPPGSQSGRKMRLRGRGLGQKDKGDLYVHLQIVTPKADTAAAKTLYEKMARELAFNPRSRLGV
jgi:curved DNA-binding protein